MASSISRSFSEKKRKIVQEFNVEHDDGIENFGLFPSSTSYSSHETKQRNQVHNRRVQSNSSRISGSNHRSHSSFKSDRQQKIPHSKTSIDNKTKYKRQPSKTLPMSSSSCPKKSSSVTTLQKNKMYQQQNISHFFTSKMLKTSFKERNDLNRETKFVEICSDDDDDDNDDDCENQTNHNCENEVDDNNSNLCYYQNEDTGNSSNDKSQNDHHLQQQEQMVCLPQQQQQLDSQTLTNTKMNHEINVTNNHHQDENNLYLPSYFHPSAIPYIHDKDNELTHTTITTNHYPLINKNILRGLIQRDSMSSLRSSCWNKQYGMREFVHTNKWNKYKRVKFSLDHPTTVQSSMSSSSSSHSFEITCMEFDSQGVLLAVADSKGFVYIYDFDEIYSVDLSTKKRDTTTTTTNEQKTVTPILKFQVGRTRVTCVKWNPFNEDQLAVSLANDPFVRVYDMSLMADNQSSFFQLSTSSYNAQNNRGYPKVVHFLHTTKMSVSQILTGTSNGTLCLWEVPKGCFHNTSLQKQIKLIWAVIPWFSNTKIHEGISNIYQFTNNDTNKTISSSRKSCKGLVLVGGDKGSLVLLDIHKIFRNAFAGTIGPHIIQTWDVGCNRAFVGGIKSISCLGYMDSLHTTTAANERTISKLIDTTIVTTGGCVFTCKIGLTSHNNNDWKIDPKNCGMIIQHKRNRKTSDSNHVTATSRFHGTSSSLVCLSDAKVKNQQSVATGRNNDPRILESNDSVVQEENVVIMYDTKKSKSILQLSVGRGLIQQLSIHPSNEWMVLALAWFNHLSMPHIYMYHLSDTSRDKKKE